MSAMAAPWKNQSPIHGLEDEAESKLLRRTHKLHTGSAFCLPRMTLGKAESRHPEVGVGFHPLALPPESGVCQTSRAAILGCGSQNRCSCGCCHCRPCLPALRQLGGGIRTCPPPLHLACQQKRAESSKDTASAPFPPPNLLEDQAVG